SAIHRRADRYGAPLRPGLCAGRRGCVARSEEHTSELQSRFDLVCRLLPEKKKLVVEGKKLSVSNLDKVLYPKVGFTKGQVIDYYIKIAPVLLPHLEDRTLTMKRYPYVVDK